MKNASSNNKSFINKKLENSSSNIAINNERGFS